jgi:hypothetical protein
LSGLDEQIEYDEQKVRVFFNIDELQKVLINDDVKPGDIFYLDESFHFVNTQEYTTRYFNLTKIAKIKNTILLNYFPSLRSLLNSVRRVGVNQFKQNLGVG